MQTHVRSKTRGDGPSVFLPEGEAPSLPMGIQALHHRIVASVSPLTVFEKLYAGDSHAFLYESLESVERRGRYSFTGGAPLAVFQAWGRESRISIGGKTHRVWGNPLGHLQSMVRSVTEWAPVFPFSGGAVGYLAYDAIRLVEDIPDTKPDELGVPDLYFIFPAELVVFDHLEKTIELVVYDPVDPRGRLLDLQARIRALEEEPFLAMPQGGGPRLRLVSNTSKADFCEMVEKAKAYIFSGDVFQVVLSRRFRFPLQGHPLNAYKALRLANPSPYMYYLRFGELDILGSSPEILVKRVKDEVMIRPLAGTRRRGKTPEEDRALAEELLADPKERAEHVMLVDLARNDIGQVCVPGSVRPTELFFIERYSRVMHLVSNVVGRIREDKDVFDLVRATFPAGTVSGAPKIRAMEIIDELEVARRGIYAGGIGYFGFNGDMDMCIAIRMILVKEKTGYLQVGAGVVADSIPEREYLETENKARALIRALEMIGGRP